MNRSILIIVMLGVMCGTGCGYMKGRAVQKVLDQEDAYCKWLADPDRVPDNEPCSRENIDLRSCPQDFQEAFLTYRQAYALIYDNTDLVGDVKDMHMSLQEAKSLTSGTAEQWAMARRVIARAARREEMHDAWYNVEKVALRYGAQTRPRK